MSGEVREVAGKLVHSHRMRVLVASLLSVSLLLGFVIVPVERAAPNPKIQSYGDGVWFAASTVTGVGYGDVYPRTGMGRLIGFILESFGVIMFGSIVAFVSVELLRYQEDYYVRRMLERFDKTEVKVDELTKRIDFLIQDKKK